MLPSPSEAATYEGYWNIKIISELTVNQAEFEFEIFFHESPCLRDLTSFNNIVAGAISPSLINDWAFEISETSVNAPNSFSTY